MTQGLPLQRSRRARLPESRSLPRPLTERDDFKRLPKSRQISILNELRGLEEIAVEIDAWLLCSKSEQENYGIGVFLSGLEAHIEVAREHKHTIGQGENFSWWIFRDSWYPDELSRLSFEEILPDILRQRLNEDVPRVGDSLDNYMAWLKRQGENVFASFDDFYRAQDYVTVYIHGCAIFAYLSAIYLGLLRAKFSGHYGAPACRE